VVKVSTSCVDAGASKSIWFVIQLFHKCISVDCLCMKLLCVSLCQKCEPRVDNKKDQSVPSAQDITGFRQCLQKGASALFSATTGLPLQSSPVCTTYFCRVFPHSALPLLIG